MTVHKRAIRTDDYRDSKVSEIIGRCKIVQADPVWTHLYIVDSQLANLAALRIQTFPVNRV